MFKIDQDWVICAIVKIQLTDHWNWIVVSSPIKTKLTSVLHPNKNQSRNGSVLHFSVSDRIRSVIYFCSPLHQSCICFNYLVRRLKNFSISVLIESSSLTFIVKRETFWHKWHPFRPTNLIHSFCCLTVRVKGEIRMVCLRHSEVVAEVIKLRLLFLLEISCWEEKTFHDHTIRTEWLPSTDDEAIDGI